MTRYAKQPEPPQFRDPTGKAPPNDIEGEADLLGYVLYEGDRFDDVAHMLAAKHFYSPAHRAIWEACLTLRDGDAPINTWTVAGVLREREQLEVAGGKVYLEKLRIERPAITTMEARIAQRIRERWRMRELVDRCWLTIGEAYDPAAVAQEALERAEHRIADITTDGPALVTTSAATDGDAVFASLSDTKAPRYVTTGIDPIDRKATGLFEDDQVILGARPGVGKTALAMQVTHNVASRVDANGTELHAIVVGLEMPREQLIERHLCAIAGIDHQRCRAKELDGNEWRDLYAAKALLSPRQRTIYEPTLTVRQIRALVRAEQAKLRKLGTIGGDPAAPPVARLALVAIDYLQLVDATCLVGARAEERERIDKAAQFFSKMAKDLHVATLLLSAMNRPERGKRPGIRDLKGSSAIEAHADSVWILHRDDVAQLGGGSKKGLAEIDIPKARFGSVGRVFMSYHRGLFGEPRSTLPPSMLDDVDD